MSSFLELCNNYYGTKDFYQLLRIEKKSTPEEGGYNIDFSFINQINRFIFIFNNHSILVKKAYWKLSLEVHPDRVLEENKENATEKFKILGKVYSVLHDKEKRSIYDETGLANVCF